MHIELRCPDCSRHFSAPARLGATEVRSRMRDHGRWHGLAEGGTFREMIVAALIRRGYVGCPVCGQAAAIDESTEVCAPQPLALAR